MKKDDLALFGYFSDNEMPFRFRSPGNYLALPESKNCVGWHYFKYLDNDPTATGVDPSNTDSNKGVENNFYEVWTPMMELMRELNTQVYKIVDYFDDKK